MYKILVLPFFVLFACNTNSFNQGNLDGEIIQHPSQDDKIVKDFDSTKFGNYELFQFAKTSNQAIDMMFRYGDTLQIIGDSDLMKLPLGYSCYVDSIQNRHNNIFEIEELSVGNNKKHIHRLLYKESMLEILELDESLIPHNPEDMAEYHHQKPELAKIVSATIRNKEIVLNYNIHVGISKRDFIIKLFIDNDLVVNVLEGVNVVQFLHIFEESTAPIFSFRDGLLEQIEIK